VNSIYGFPNLNESPMPKFNRRQGLIFGLGTLTTALAPPAMAQTGALTRGQVNGPNLAYRDYGPADSELILVALSGLGDGTESFTGIAPELARHARVILYDRAGYGQSETYSGPHDAAHAAAELEGLLKVLAIERPVVLLGHSLGGIYAQYFAAKYPHRVRGLILDDTRPTGMTSACLAQKRAGCTIPALLKYTLPGAGPREADSILQAEDQAEAAGGSTLPTLILVRAGGANPKSLDGLWLAQQKAMQGQYPNSVLKQAPKGGHYIHKDARDWFILEVTSFLRRL
jgi:pimeloyl-ACP methyl ester carboxylesterase